MALRVNINLIIRIILIEIFKLFTNVNLKINDNGRHIKQGVPDRTHRTHFSTAQTLCPTNLVLFYWVT
jgi:hypothetical protein